MLISSASADWLPDQSRHEQARCWGGESSDLALGPGRQEGREPEPQVVEASVVVRPMTEGREVVEDYGHVGLTLRAHPVSLLREEFARRRSRQAAALRARRLQCRRLETRCAWAQRSPPRRYLPGARPVARSIARLKFDWDENEHLAAISASGRSVCVRRRRASARRRSER